MVNKICGKKQEQTSLALNPFTLIEDDPIEAEDIAKDNSGEQAGDSL